MTRKLPPHFELATLQGFDLPAPAPEIIAELTYELDPQDGKTVLFKFNVNYVNHTDIPATLPPMSFVILQDCKVTICLDRNIKWRWSQQYHQISAKEAYGDLYGNVQHVDDYEFCFLAKHNSPLSPSKVQRFNLNIDYQQGDRWLPITIDPDVGNPRPPNTLEDSTWLKFNGGTSVMTIITGTI
ncbi:MAG: hypothetical protein RLZZ157_56 [Pseudomonadota bacterium]